MWQIQTTTDSETELVLTTGDEHEARSVWAAKKKTLARGCMHLFSNDQVVEEHVAPPLRAGAKDFCVPVWEVVVQTVEGWYATDHTGFNEHKARGRFESIASNRPGTARMVQILCSGDLVQRHYFDE